MTTNPRAIFVLATLVTVTILSGCATHNKAPDPFAPLETKLKNAKQTNLTGNGDFAITPLPATQLSAQTLDIKPVAQDLGNLGITPIPANKNPAPLVGKIDKATAIPKSANTNTPVKMIPTWQITATDKTVSAALSRWCADSQGACTTVRWNSRFDVPVEAAATFTGNFNDAITGLMESLYQSTKHEFHHQLSLNGVLIITD